MARDSRSAVTVILMIAFISISIYINISSLIASIIPYIGNMSDNMQYIIDTIIGILGVIVPWRVHSFNKSRQERKEQIKDPDIHVEDWYPKEDEIHISISNLGDYRAKDLGLLVIAKPWRQYMGPTGIPNKGDFNPAIEKESSPLQRVEGRIGKNVDNYLQGGENDVHFKSQAKVQVEDDELSRIGKMPYSFSLFLEELPDEVKAITFQIVLVYENALGEQEKPIRIYTYTTAIDHPDHVLRGYEAAPETTEFGTRVVVRPETFEETFKTPNVANEGGIIPSTNIGFFSIDPERLEDRRAEEAANKSKSEEKTNPDLEIESWYPVDDDLKIVISNIGASQAKNICVSILAAPISDLPPPPTPVVFKFKPEVKNPLSKLVREQDLDTEALRKGSLGGGRNLGNYLAANELNIKFKTTARASLVDSEMSPSGDLPQIIQSAPNQIDGIIFQLILTYENAVGEQMEPVRFATFVAGANLPDEMENGIAVAETTDSVIFDEIMFSPETFEDVFKIPIFRVVNQKDVKQTITPKTGIGPFSTPSHSFEE